MKRRAVVEVLTALKEPESRPVVYIDVMKGGEITYGVRCTGRSAKRARESAQVEFNQLRIFAVSQESAILAQRQKQIDDAMRAKK